MARSAEIGCLELEDHGSVDWPAERLFGTPTSRDSASVLARISDQFVTDNRAVLALMDITIEKQFDGREISLTVRSGSTVGAVPLISPSSGRHDLGLVVQPRFPWIGIGPMLSEMGWRIAPVPLRLPLLRRSERRVPPWVLSSMILSRIAALLDSLDRKFEMSSATMTTPRGRIDWANYATHNLPRAAADQIPCTFPELRDDRQLKGAIRHSLTKQLGSLETQRHHGAFVQKLIDLAMQLQRRVAGVAPVVPSRCMMDAWLQRPLRTDALRDGIQGIEWTVEDRGLAGLSDLEGLPWRMPMEQFFEAWVETISARVAAFTGGGLRAGRKNETIHPLRWQPAFGGSQKALIPDVILEFDDKTVIIDAKYKRHWEELQWHSWARTEEELREQHRHDILQVLAYANLASTKNVVACLTYPCTQESWTNLRERGRLFHKGAIAAGDRSVQLWLTAIPMSADVDAVARPFIDAIREAA